MRKVKDAWKENQRGDEKKVIIPERFAERISKRAGKIADTMITRMIQESEQRKGMAMKQQSQQLQQQIGKTDVFEIAREIGMTGRAVIEKSKEKMKERFRKLKIERAEQMEFIVRFLEHEAPERRVPSRRKVKKRMSPVMANWMELRETAIGGKRSSSPSSQMMEGKSETWKRLRKFVIRANKRHRKRNMKMGVGLVKKKK